MAKLKDSGDRTEFETGAVRDLGIGKGRFDLVPLSVLGQLMGVDKHRVEIQECLFNIDKFLYSLDTVYLYLAIDHFRRVRGWEMGECAIEVSKHFEDGAIKYKPHNWEKGIVLSSYISSGVRHLVQWDMGDQSDPHDRAFVWNMMCAIWTVDHRPDMIDTPYHTYDCKMPYTGWECTGAATSECEGQLEMVTDTDSRL